MLREDDVMKQLKFGLIGAGERGANCYAPYSLKYPPEVKFVCVAEPIQERLDKFSDDHNIDIEHRYTSWEEMLANNYNLDGLIIATQDQDHYEPAMLAIEKGYNLLLEKPIAENIEKSSEIVEAAEKKGIFLMICHVLRYTPFFKEVKKAIDSGIIGEVKTIHHIENIGFWHFAHSFVRGNWGNSKVSAPMIVAKCTHDTDIINFLLDGKKCSKVSSFGSLSYFKEENAPKDATKTCKDCPHNKSCMYSAYKYLEDRTLRKNFKDIVFRTNDNKEFLDYLFKSDYGRCVYKCDNDVMDHQVVSMEYEDGTTVSWQATAFTLDTIRQMKIMGTKGEIEGCIDDNEFKIKEFNSGHITTINIQSPNTLHSGGDECIMETFTNILRDGDYTNKLYSGRLSLQGHIMAYAAEESRVNGGKVIEI